MLFYLSFYVWRPGYSTHLNISHLLLCGLLKVLFKNLITVNMFCFLLFYVSIQLVCGAANSKDLEKDEPQRFSRFVYDFKLLQIFKDLLETTAKLQNDILEIKRATTGIF